MDDRDSAVRTGRLAEAALAPYAMANARLIPIKPIENATFRIEAPDGGRYCLRIHRAGVRAATVRSELLWLAALRRDTDLIVPEPVAADDGALVTLTAADGSPAPRCCMLFRWIEGSVVPPEELRPPQLFRVGALAAGLHRHAEGWTPPRGFARDRVDEGLLVDPWLVGRGMARGWHLLGAGDEAAIRATMGMAARAVRALGASRAEIGLIHGDLAPSNLLFRGDEVGVIDFDDCVIGPYPYDIALALRELEDLEAYPELRAAFLGGYRTVRPLPPAREVYLDTFISMAHVLRLLWVMEHARHPEYRDWAPSFAARSLRRLRRYLGEDGE